MSRFTEQDLAKWFGDDTKHIPISWLCGGGLAISMGIAVLFISSLRKRIHEDLV